MFELSAFKLLVVTTSRFGLVGCVRFGFKFSKFRIFKSEHNESEVFKFLLLQFEDFKFGYIRIKLLGCVH